VDQAVLAPQARAFGNLAPKRVVYATCQGR
jgi:hypothetical protein